MLSKAVANAREWDFDPPTEQALLRTRQLLGRIAETYDDLQRFSLSVGVDGGIEITASSRDYSVSIDVSPAAVVTTAAGDHHERPVIWSAVEPTWDELAREIDKAA